LVAARACAPCSTAICVCAGSACAIACFEILIHESEKAIHGEWRQGQSAR
jgi:hypothetical protein